MSKFLKLIEANRPLTAQELDKVTPIKRIIQRALLSDNNKNILEDIGLQKVEVVEQSSNIILKFKDGTVITFIAEVIKEEDEDAVISAGEMIASGDPAKKRPVTRELEKYKAGVKRIEPKVAQKLSDRNIQISSLQKDLA